MPRIRRHVVPFRAAARHLFQTANPQLIHRHRDSVLKKLLWECRSPVVVYLWARPENAEGRVFNPGQPLSPHHQGHMNHTPLSRQPQKIFTISDPPPVVEEMIALRQSAKRPRDVTALELACYENGQANIWQFAMRVRKYRIRRSQTLVRRSMLRHVAPHLRGHCGPDHRRPVHRAPCRSIGARTKSTRKRGGNKPASIGGDPDPVSPSRASDGGAR